MSLMLNRMGLMSVNNAPPPLTFMEAGQAATNDITVTIPSTQPGDLIVTCHMARSGSGTPALTADGNYTTVVNRTGTNTRVVFQMRIADGTEGGTSVGALNGTAFNGTLCSVIRASVPILGFSAEIGGQSQYLGTSSNLSNQTISSGSGVAPLIAFAAWGVGGSGASKGFTPSPDATIDHEDTRTMKWKAFASSPENITCTSTGQSGLSKWMNSFYIELTV